MRYAMHRVGETTIFQTVEAPEDIIAEITPPGVVSIPVGIEVSDATHIVVDGEVVPKPAGS